MPSSNSVAERLVSVGVKRVYGLPGGEMLDLLEAIRKVGIEFVLVHHEGAAAFMAAAEGRYLRSIGACISTLGPGATNLVTGIAHAYLDRCPVIALTAQLPTTYKPDYTHQRLALHDLFAPITKGSFVVQAASAIATVDQALSLAATEPFGPVSLHIPRDVMSQFINNEHIDTQPNNEAVKGNLDFEDMVTRLNQAEHPLVVVGVGTPASASASVRQFVEVYGAPVGVTAKVKGMIDAIHPLFTGTYGGMMADSVLLNVISERDLVLCIGVDPIEIDRPWQLDAEKYIWMLPSLNVDQTTLPENTWLGDIQSGLRQLMTAITPRSFDGQADAARICSAVRTKLESGVPAQLVEMSPLHVLDILAKTWPTSDIVCCDVGAHKLLIGQQWPSSIPNRFFLSNGLSSMGYGVAASIALNLASGGVPVLAVVGDGGLMMHMGELETAVRQGAHVLYVVFYDHSLTLIESSQRRRGHPLYGMNFTLPDIDLIGKAFKLPTWQATNEAELITAVEAFANVDGPALIGVTIDAREYDQQNT